MQSIIIKRKRKELIIVRGIVRVADQERIARYKKAFPKDIRTDKEILNELNRVKKDKSYIDKWINQQVYNDK